MVGRTIAPVRAEHVPFCEKLLRFALLSHPSKQLVIPLAYNGGSAPSCLAAITEFKTKLILLEREKPEQEQVCQ